jgi:hypothetical protein
MTEQKTFTFTVEQIKDIFRAGVREGGDDSWGGFRECVDAVYHILNEDKPWGDPDYTPRHKIEEWFKD